MALALYRSDKRAMQVVIPQTREVLAALLQAEGAVDLRGLHSDYSRLAAGVYFEHRRGRIDVFAIPGDPTRPWIKPPHHTWITTVSLHLDEREEGTLVTVRVRRHLRPETRHALLLLVPIAMMLMIGVFAGPQGLIMAGYMVVMAVLVGGGLWLDRNRPSGAALDLVSPLLHRLSARESDSVDPYRRP